MLQYRQGLIFWLNTAWFRTYFKDIIIHSKMHKNLEIYIVSTAQQGVSNHYFIFSHINRGLGAYIDLIFTKSFQNLRA